VPLDGLDGSRQTYSGPLEVGEDPMSFEIGETVHVQRHGHPLDANAAPRLRASKEM
jgi:hypothetical protein